MGEKMIELLYIIGKSSSGKDTVKNKLVNVLENENIRFKELVIYTTREIRTGEEQGVDYNFVNENTFQKLLANNKVVESRSYEKIQGLVRYFTVLEDKLFEQELKYVVGVGTLVSYNNLVQYFSRFNKGMIKITPIYLEVDNSSRLLRAIRRELLETESKQNFEEVCRRFEADELDYSEENILQSGISKRFQNDSIDSTIIEICSYLNILNKELG